MRSAEILAHLRALPVLGAVTPAACAAEAAWGRPSSSRPRVILRTRDGYAVYDAATCRALSPFRRGPSTAISDYASLAYGGVPTTGHPKSGVLRRDVADQVDLERVRRTT